MNALRNVLLLIAASILSPESLGCGRRAVTTASVTSSTSATAAPGGTRHRGVPCGDLECAQYDAPADAFLEAIASEPLVLGVGETHAPRGATVPSAARRFANDLLPLLAGRASDLLLELMKPPSGCGDATNEVRESQRAVTSRQSEANQGEYVDMGERARALGIVPDLLRPTCGDLAAMLGDGGDSLDGALEAIARLTVTKAKSLIERDARSDNDRGKTVVVYGGALHNDLAPPPHAVRWTYASDLSAFVEGRFVAIDLIVPEFIGDDESWRSLPWIGAYDAARLGGKTTLFRLGERSFVIVFARTPPQGG